MTGPWWEGPLWTYDTETTGTDPEHDRLVTLCLDHYDHPDATTPTDSLRLVIDPGVPIPETAAAVHGYDNQRATTEGITPIDALLQLEEALAAVTATLTPVVVYNAVFDLTLTDREMRRHLHRPLALQFPVIDPLVIDRRVDRYVKGSGQRKLQPTATRYGVTLTDWHTAEADAYAALSIARRIGHKHQGTLPDDLRDLWRWQAAARREQATDLQTYLARVGRTNDDGTPITIPTDWPMCPYTGDAE